MREKREQQVIDERRERMKSLVRKGASIKVRSLLYMFCALLLIIVLVMGLVYKRMEALFIDSKYKNANGEMNQIASQISGLYKDIDLKMDLLLFSRANTIIADNGLYSTLEKTYAYQDIAELANDILNQTEYLKSIYLFTGSEKYIYITKYNFRRSEAPDYTPFEESIQKELLEGTARQMMLTGGIRQSELPYMNCSYSPPAQNYVSAVKAAGKVRVLMLLDTQYFNSFYDQISLTLGQNYWLLNNSGNVISFSGASEDAPMLADFRNTFKTAKAGGTECTGDLWLWMPINDTPLTLFMSTSLESFYHSMKELQHMIVLLSLVAMAVIGTMFVLWMRQVFSPLKAMLTSMNQVSMQIFLPVSGVRGHSEISELIYHYNAMLQDLQDLTVQNQEIEAQKRRSELVALRNQLNPHFLFNTLNSIRWMALEKRDRQVADCIALLGKIITPLYRAEEPLHTLEKEMSILDSYIKIVNICYGGGIVYEKDIEPGTESLQVMHFLLQPLVENCITHGFNHTEYRGNIMVRVHITGDDLCIQVMDDGEGLTDAKIERLNGMLADKEEHLHSGMLNVGHRILLQYGEPYGINVASSGGGGFKATILLPVIRS